MKPYKKGLSLLIVEIVVLCLLGFLFKAPTAYSQRRDNLSDFRMNNDKLNQMKGEVLTSSTTASNFNERFQFARLWDNALRRQGKGKYLEDENIQTLMHDIKRYRDGGDLKTVAPLLDKIFHEFQRIENMSGADMPPGKQRAETGPSQKGNYYVADVSTAAEKTLPAYIRIAGFENLDAPIQGHALEGTPPVMRPSRDAIEGKTSANIVFYGNNKGKILGNYSAEIAVKIPEGSLQNCTEISLWVMTTRDINEMDMVFRERNGNVFKTSLKTIHGRPEWQRIIINLFGDLEIKQTSLREENEFVDPGKIIGFEIMLPVTQAGEFKLDKIDALKREGGQDPLISIEAIDDSSGDQASSQTRYMKLSNISSRYNKIANLVARDSMTGNNLNETIKQCREAVGMVHEYKKEWEEIAGREEKYEGTYSYIRNKYILEKIISYNDILLKSLENRISNVSGTLLEKKLIEKTSEAEIYEVKYMSDGLRISGILTKPSGEGVYPALITDHGGFGNAYFMSGERALTFAKAGYVVFSPDYRGTRTSEGRQEARIEMSRIIEPSTHLKPLETTKYGRRVLGVIHDIENAIVMVRGLSFVDGNRVAILGHSMGHIASRLVLERNSSLSAGVLIAAFIVEDRGQIDRISSPVFLAYGDRDRVAPPEKGYELRDMLQKYGKSVQMEIYKGKNHQTVIDACLGDAVNFLNKNMKKRM
ncbi:MAG: acetylxylan esterase [Nitrospirae bacterium]|nr:acetylxylan esterase [Nitrospirota bacterium]